MMRGLPAASRRIRASKHPGPVDGLRCPVRVTTLVEWSTDPQDPASRTWSRELTDSVEELTSMSDADVRE